jgi:hypothetical protein
VLALAGMKTRAHLRDNLAGSRLRLDPEVLAHLDARAAALGVVGERHPPAMMKIIDREP